MSNSFLASSQDVCNSGKHHFSKISFSEFELSSITIVSTEPAFLQKQHIPPAQGGFAHGVWGWRQPPNPLGGGSSGCALSDGCPGVRGCHTEGEAKFYRDLIRAPKSIWIKLYWRFRILFQYTEVSVFPCFSLSSCWGMHSGYLQSVSMSTAGSQAAEPCGHPAVRKDLCQPALEGLHIHTQASPVSVPSVSFSSPKWMHKVSSVHCFLFFQLFVFS